MSSTPVSEKGKFLNGYLLIHIANRGIIKNKEELLAHPLLKESQLPEEVLHQLLGLVEWRRTGHSEVGFPNVMYNHLSQFLLDALTYDYSK